MRTRRQTRARRSIVALALALFLGSVVGIYAVLQYRPDLAAQAADRLRDIFGDQVVASLETAVYETQDRINSLIYHVGGARPPAPWETASATADGGPVGVAPAAVPTMPPAQSAAGASDAAAGSVPATGDHSAQSGGETPAQWIPPALPTTGTLTGVGQWSAYLRDANGRVVAQRAFIQPDPDRPYAVAAIVAFDLHAVRLHLVLGSEEPASSVLIPRTGKIPAGDRTAGTLLAAFNGGFKARHGHFGVMMNGIELIPPIPAFATVALYRDGRVRIGAWGSDISDAPDILAWRQNGPLIIHDGTVNPHTNDTASKDWGIVLNGVTAVWRSGLGISPDGRTLYYVAGNSLTLPMLVRTLVATRSNNAMQLDINKGMVHFDTFQQSSNGLQPTPLFPEMQSQQDSRFLTADTRDFFYMTASNQSARGK